MPPAALQLAPKLRQINKSARKVTSYRNPSLGGSVDGFKRITSQVSRQPNIPKRRQNMTQQMRQVVSRTNNNITNHPGFKELSKIYNTATDKLDDAQIHSLQQNPPSTTTFPSAIFSLALIKYAFDLLALIFTSGIAYFFLWIFSAMITGVVFLWMLNKMSFMRKLLLRRLTRRFIVSSIGKTVAPFIPFTVIFVLMAHFYESRFVQTIFTVLESVKNADLKEIAVLRQNISEKARAAVKNIEGDIIDMKQAKQNRFVPELS